MRGRNKTWDSGDENHLRRREIRHDPGQPEELPHKKKAAKKPRQRVDHKHEYVEIIHDWYWGITYTEYRCKVCNKYNHRKTLYQNRMRRK